MNILLIHQNFPGQYKHLGPALTARGNRVLALTPKVKTSHQWQGVEVVPYVMNRSSSKDIHRWLGDLESKIIRAESCFDAAVKIRQFFTPDVILAHPGWGEPMFLHDIWPKARIGLYCEWYREEALAAEGFDPEFPVAEQETAIQRLRFRNLNTALHVDMATAGITPTRFQFASYPKVWQDMTSIIHDGIDTRFVCPNPDAALEISGDLTLTRNDEVISFINRNLEPSRGYHQFMRVLPHLLRARPQAHVVVLGGDAVSYGAAPAGGGSWKQLYINEVRGDISDADWARVHFLGRVPYGRFLSLLQISRAHIYLTYPFVLSWSLMEAMSAGAAIVASDTAPVREVMRNGETGVLVDFFDQDALLSQLIRLLKDAGLRARLGGAARQHIRQHYDLKTICLPQQLRWVDALGHSGPQAPIA